MNGFGAASQPRGSKLPLHKSLDTTGERAYSGQQFLQLRGGIDRSHGFRGVQRGDAIGILGFGEQFTQVQALAFGLALISLRLATLPERRMH